MIIGPLFLLGGYTLIYAAVANHGRYATEPWNGILADAYLTAPQTGAPQSPGSGSASGNTGSSAPSGTQGFSRPRSSVGGGLTSLSNATNRPPARTTRGATQPSFSFWLPSTRGFTG